MELKSSINWQNLFSPDSIAVIGASNSPGTWGHTAIQGLLAGKGRHIYAVNPNADEVLGIKAYPSVVDIPDTIDLAVIVVTARLVPAILRECISKGIRAAIVITSGFAETGEEGRELEEEIARIAREGDINFIGPNSMGHADTRTQLSTFGYTRDTKSGPVALLSQSGGTCPCFPSPARIRAASPRRRFTSCPTRTFVPRVTVIGRSVFSRTVRHGTPRKVVSSWMPPESVMTRTA